MRFFLYSPLFLAVFILFSTLVSSSSAQGSEPVPDIKKWSINLGHWVNAEQRRSGPDEPWEKVSSEWNNTMMPGGFFVQTPGKATKEDGSVASWVQVWGHDPVTKINFSHWYASDGYQGKATFHWRGRTLITEGVVIPPNGEEFKVRGKQKIAAGAKSMELTVERLTNGEWWVTRKVKGKKVD